MGVLRAVIVDDEAPARALLAEYIAAVPDVEVVASCANGFEAVRAVAELDPDVLFLDVQMPKLSGFDVVELLERELPVVFVTAYDEYAVRAFEINAADYLLKPFTAERLARALDRVRARIAGAPAANARDVAARARRPSGPLERILVREGSAVQVVPVDALDVVEARDDYVVLRSGGRELRKQQCIADLEARLDPGRFVRVHRSFILNVERLARLELYAKDSRIAILTDGSRVPVSRAGYARLRTLL